MKELVSYFEEIGGKNIRTYMQSGNLVFQSAPTLDRLNAMGIAKRIREKKGFEPLTMLLAAADLRIAIENNPFPTDNGKIVHFFFLESPVKQPDLARLESIKTATESFLLIGSVFYLHAPDGIGRSRLAANVEKALGVAATARNWNTVIKLASMTGVAPPALNPHFQP